MRQPPGAPTLAKACALAAVLALWGCAAEPPPGPLPDLVLVTIDTLRADHMSLYGYGRETTPEMDAFAAEGLVFDAAASAAPCTVPAHTSMLTGRYPAFHSAGSSNGGYKVVEAEQTLAEILAARGYFTAAVVSNPVLNHRLGLNQGFDVYDDDLEERELNRSNPERRSDRAVDRAIELMERAGERPLFLWLHVQDPHGPYTPPEGWREEWGPGVDERSLPAGSNQSGDGAIPRYQLRGQERNVGAYVAWYDREISYADAQLGRLFDALEGRGVAREGLTIVTADHGEAIGEDGYWFAHCVSVGPDQVHVPLIVRGRGVEPGRSSLPVSTVSVFSTFLRFLDEQAEPGGPAGVPTPPEVAFAGPLPLTPAAAAREPVYLESLNQIGLVQGTTLLRWDRYHVDDEAFWSGGNPNTHSPWHPLGTAWQAFPLPAAVDGAGESRTTEEGLRELLGSYEAAAVRSYSDLASLRQTTRLPKQVEDALRAIGYIQ